ncbi:MAG: hypothetical protein K9N51_08960, partial [Candidatus Pacebacteria bacterium]|nr:hypothetical protein [Candidatus Paceibacterota bacterium]
MRIAVTGSSSDITGGPGDTVEYINGCELLLPPDMLDEENLHKLYAAIGADGDIGVAGDKGYGKW